MHELLEIFFNGTAVNRRVEDISKDVQTKFSDIFNKCVYYSLPVESMGITSTTQMCIFARNVASDFEVSVELVDLLQCKTRQRYRISVRHYHVVFRNIIWNYLSSWAHLMTARVL
jgi:hypothetical protein